MIKVNCKECGKEFSTYPCRVKSGAGKFCSRKCYEPTRIKELTNNGNETRFKPGHQTSENRVMPSGADHKAWKGQEVGYRGMHYWVIRQKGKAQKCSKCGSTKSVQWANVDHKYLRDIDDYVEMCSSCHKLYDLQMKRS
jgi:hypothetical protein